MCSIEPYEIILRYGNDDVSSGGGRTMKKYSTEDALVSLGLTLNSIDSWLQTFKANGYR